MEYREYLEKIWSLIQKGLELARLRAEEGDVKSQCVAMQKERAVLEALEEEAMKGEEFLALPYLIWIGTGNRFERHLLYLLFSFVFQPGCRRMCQKLGWREITLELAMFTFEETPSVQECYYVLERDTMFVRCFLHMDDMAEEAWEVQGIFERELRLNRRVADLMLTCEPAYVPYQSFLQVFIHEDILERENGQKDSAGEHMKKEVLNKLLSVFQKEDLEKENCIIEICGQEGSGRKRFLSQISAALGRELVLWQVHGGLSEEKRKQQYRAWLRECSLWGAIPAMQIEGREEEQTVRELWMLVEEKQAPVVMVFTEQARRPFFCAKKVFSFAMPDIFIDKAQRVETIFGWEDIVLPEELLQNLKMACNYVKYRQKVYGQWGLNKIFAYGKGVSMVFAGAPGTGKTMAAQVIAGEMDMELYRINLAAIVSKYIGETEKNLNEVFEQAKQSQVILLFDEADILFSKRTEVKDSHDKHSNMEAAFLLQKMEEYEGVSILTTNFFKNFDEAFRRRMTFIMDFPFPDAGYRRQIWQKAVPKQMPVEELDFDYLSKTFSLSGSNIKNIIRHSAFLAAAGNHAVGMEQILAAVKNEYAKLGKILTAEEAGEYYMLLQK